MPKINSWRVANIQLEEGKKVIPDVNYKFEGKHALKLLENGGGKTSLLHTLIQTVLGKVKFSDRNYEKTVAKGKTGHSVLEWELDGEDPKYLVTGFCFRNGKEDGKFDYFNYIFAYNEDSEINIDTIPLIEEGLLRNEVTGYKALKEKFKEISLKKGIKISIFDNKREYHEAIKKYGVLSKEWENIRRINGEESKSEKFFSNGETTEKLMKNILIPSIEDSKTVKGSKNDLYESFKGYRKNLIELSQFEKDLKDYQLIEEEAIPLIESLEKLQELQQMLKEEKQKIVSTHKGYIEFKEEKEKEMNENISQIEMLKEMIKDLNWKIESHEYVKKNLKLTDLNDQKAKIELKLEAEQQKQIKLIQQANEMNAMKIFGFYSENNVKLQETNEKIKAMEASTPELMKQHAENEQKLEEKMNIYQNLIEEEISLINGQIESTELILDELENSIEKMVSDIAKNQNKLANLNDWFENFEKLKSEISSHFEEEEMAKPEMTKEKMMEEMSDQEEQISLLSREVKNLSEDIETEKDNLRNNQVELKDNLKTLSNKKSELISLENQEAMLKDLISVEKKVYLNIHAEKENILLHFSQEQKNLQEKINSIYADKEKVKEEIDMLSGKDYFVPNKSVGEMKKFLEENEIYTILGSQWLSELEKDDSEKDKILKAHPLLPYMIVYEKGQFNNINKALEKNKKWDKKTPYIFIEKSELDQVNEEKENEFKKMNLLFGNVFVFKPYEASLFTSKTKLEEMKQSLNEKYAKLSEDFKELNEDFKRINQLNNKIVDFFNKNNENTIPNVKEEINTLTQNIESLKKEEKEISEKINILTMEKEEKEEEKNEAIEMNKALNYKISVITNYALEFSKNDLKRKEMGKISEEIDLLEIEKAKSKIDKEETKEELELMKKQKSETSFEKETLSKDFKDLSIKKIAVSFENISKNTAKNDFETAKLSFFVTKKQLDDKQYGRSELDELVRNYNATMEDQKKRIEKLGVSFEWLNENYRLVSEEEIDNKEMQLKHINEELKTSEKEIQIVSSNIDKMVGSISTVENSIKKKYDLEPYQYEEGENKELFVQKEEKSNGKKSQLEMTNKEIEKFVKEIENALEEMEEKFTLKQKVEMAQSISMQEFLSQTDSPKQYWKDLSKAYSKVLKDVKYNENKVLDLKAKYVKKLEKTNNSKLFSIINDLEELTTQERIFETEKMIELFNKIFNGLKRLSENILIQIGEKQKDRDHLIEECYRKAKTIYDSILEIPKIAKINIYGRDIKTFDIDWKDEVEVIAKEKISNYIEEVLNVSMRMSENGKDDRVVEDYVAGSLKTDALINVIAPIKDCRVKIFKPSRETILKEGVKKYDWDEASKWSGGEKYSIYMVTYMLLISHIRTNVTGVSDNWKTIIADNPFGTASSDHVIQPFLEIANKNKIQVICFTAIKEENILRNFPVVYSSKYYSVAGKEIMESKNLNELKTLVFSKD